MGATLDWEYRSDIYSTVWPQLSTIFDKNAVYDEAFPHIRAQLVGVGRHEELVIADYVLEDGETSHLGGELFGRIEGCTAGKAFVKFGRRLIWPLSCLRRLPE